MLQVMIGGPVAFAMGLTLLAMAYGSGKGVHIPTPAFVAALVTFLVSAAVATHAIVKDNKSG